MPQLCRKRGAAFPGLCCLLEGVSELQHAEVVAVAAYDLDAYWKIVWRESGGDRDRRVAGDGDVVAALHPVEVVVHAHAGDLARPILLDRKRRQLADRADEKLMALQQDAHALK